MNNLRDFLCGLALISALLGVLPSVWAQPGRNPSDRAAWQTEVEGFGPTVSDAERDALERACEQLREHLTTRYPALIWSPDPAYLWKRGLVYLKGTPVERNLERIGKVQQVNLQLSLSSVDLKEIETLNREHVARERLVRSKERHRLLALVLAGIAAGLVVLRVYLWLEEATRGYSTGLLRVTALVILGLVVAVLIWVA